MFFFHALRISTQPIPNCCDATSQAWPKSWEISSVITAILNGDFARRAESDFAGFGNSAPERFREVATAAIPLAINWRREKLFGMATTREIGDRFNDLESLTILRRPAQLFPARVPKACVAAVWEAASWPFSRW